MKLNWRKTSFLPAVFLLACLLPYESKADVSMSAGMDSGYSGKVMDKIISKWNPPKQLKNESSLKLVLSLDGEGNLLDCKVRKSSGLQALDVSACAAARSAAPFGDPPYSMPAEVYLAFWSGAPGNVAAPDPARAPLDTSSAENARARSAAANERAKDLAEKASKKTGKAMPEQLPAKAAKAQPQAPPAPVGQAKSKSIPASSDAPAGTAVPVAQAATASAANASGKAAQKTEAAQASQDAFEAKRQRYLSRITWDLRKAMYVPAESKPGDYQATVKVICAPNGKITRYDLLKSSGDPIMDKYILVGIQRAGKILPPIKEYGNEFDLTFHLKR